MKKLIVFLLAFIITSCIPVKIAPKFKNQDYKIVQARKFQKKMPRETAFIFKDSKGADEFYNYINKKYRLNNVDVGINVPFEIEGETLYLSYYEANREDQTFNLPLVVTDEVLERKAGLKVFEDNYTSRTGHWYIVLTIFDKNINNCLRDKHHLKEKTTQYLKALKEEYLTTQNYEELLFTKKT